VQEMLAMAQRQRGQRDPVGVGLESELLHREAPSGSRWYVREKLSVSSRKIRQMCRAESAILDIFCQTVESANARIASGEFGVPLFRRVT
jgi:hypothetical protein